MSERKTSQDQSAIMEVSSFFPNRHLGNFERLSGGYTSDVFRGELDGQVVIVKHARGREIFYPSYRISKETRMSTEIEVLSRLAPIFPDEVPQILEYDPKQSIAVMTDVGQNATLGLSYLLSGRAESTHGTALGNFLARLKQATDGWEPFTTVENAEEQIRTRGQETDAALPEWGKRLREYYLGQQKFLWVDGHPKNIFFGDQSPLIGAIDWDCSHFADPDYMLPNFLGQLPVFAAMGHISINDAINFTKATIFAYNKVSPIDPETERKMVFYAATQIIQRQDGKWLFDVCGGNDEESLKRKAFLFYFGRKATSITTFNEYLEAFETDLSQWIR